LKVTEKEIQMRIKISKILTATVKKVDAGVMVEITMKTLKMMAHSTVEVMITRNITNNKKFV
jgi:hypothetical protein